MTGPFELLTEVRQQCGDLFALNLFGMGRIIFLCSAELLHQVYRKSEEQVVAGEIRRKMVGYLSGEKSSVSIDGLDYAKRRKVVTPYISGRKVLRQADAIRQLTEEALDRMPIGEAFELQPYLNRIARDITMRMFFGPPDREAIRRLGKLCDLFLDAFGWPAVQNPMLQRRFPWSPWSRFLSRRQAVYDAIRQEIYLRQRDGSDSDDLLSALMNADLAEDEEIEHEIITHELAGLLVGGPETAAKVLAWTLLGVLSEPKILSRLRQELDEVLGEDPIDAGHLRQLLYLDAVMNEGMRHQSIGPFAGPRLAKQAFDLGGYEIAAGSVMVQCLSEVGRSPCFPIHDRFDPANFFQREIRARDWVPFGGGTRLCPGKGSGQLIVAVTLATLVQRADLELAEGSTRPARRGIGYQPKNGLRVRLKGFIRSPRDPAADERT